MLTHGAKSKLLTATHSDCSAGGRGTPLCGPPTQRSKERGGRGRTVRAALAAARAGWVRTSRLLNPRKNKVTVRNIGHFDDEIDMTGLPGLEGMQVDIIEPQAVPFGFSDGHSEFVLASGQHHNSGRATDRDSHVPATVLTGLLGSGKTTLYGPW